jgi:phosphomannomutase
MDRYIFDVDGTLTPSRQKILPEMKSLFLEFIDRKKVYLVTGSDYEKTLEQVGKEIIESVEKVYNCSGSDVWKNGKNIERSKWVLPYEIKVWLDDKFNKSDYPVRTGTHYEDRPGLCNFSILGRKANLEQRKDYVKYDNEVNERVTIVKEFNNVFCNVIASAGGETGIDIHPIGKDKSQILSDFSPTDTTHFFGDRMDKDGNDYSLSLKVDKKYPVKTWKDTFTIVTVLLGSS